MPKHPGNAKSLEPYLLTTHRDKPLNKQIAIRIDEITYQQLQELPDKAEFCRNAIQKALDERKKDIVPDTLK